MSSTVLPKTHSSHVSFVSRLKSLEPGRPALGTALTIASPFIAQVTAMSESEFIMIDAEHAPMTFDVVTQMVHAYMATATTAQKHALIRIPSHDVAWIKWALDSGCSGIIVPMVNSASEMKAILDHALYPPNGRRSFGPLYAQFAAVQDIGVSSYFNRAKAGDICIIPMIESKEGLENCDAILGLPGVDGVFIGPTDLRLSLGMSAATDGDEEKFENAMKTVVMAAKKHGRVVGSMGVGTDSARKRAADGLDFLLSTYDYAAIVAGYAADLTKAKLGIDQSSGRLKA